MELTAADTAIVYVRLPGSTGGAAGDVRMVAAVGGDLESAKTMARSATNGQSYGRGSIFIEALGRDVEGPRFALVASPRPIGHPVMRRLRMIGSVARQGFALCAARDRPVSSPTAALDRSLEPLLPGFLTASAAMSRLVEQIQRLQGNDLTVLVTGESGTGKELVARAIHTHSPRSGAPFVTVNSGSMPTDLLESNLFGHVRGAFTGAVANKKGLFEAAEGGSIFFDEIGTISLETQAKLLRVIQEKEFMRVGSVETQKADVRIIAATNVDLKQMVAEGKFRDDLYYRLCVITIPIPPDSAVRSRFPLPPGRNAARRFVGQGVRLGIR